MRIEGIYAHARYEAILLGYVAGWHTHVLSALSLGPPSEKYITGGAYKDGPETWMARPVFFLFCCVFVWLVQNFLARPIMDKTCSGPSLYAPL